MRGDFLACRRTDDDRALREGRRQARSVDYPFSQRGGAALDSFLMKRPARTWRRSVRRGRQGEESGRSGPRNASVGS